MRNISAVLLGMSWLCFVQRPLFATQTQSAPSESCCHQVVEMTKDVVAPILVSKVEPIIPKALLEKKHSRSTAIVQVVITTEGAIDCAKALKTEDPEFAKVVLEAVTKWKYKPGLKNGKPVPICTTIFMSLGVR